MAVEYRPELREARARRAPGPYPGGLAVNTAALDPALRQILSGDHHDPHSVLGVHPERSGLVVRAFRPVATSMRVLPKRGAPVVLEQLDGAGLFAGYLPRRKPP